MKHLSLTESVKYETLLNIIGYNMSGSEGAVDNENDMGSLPMEVLVRCSTMVEWVAFVRTSPEAAAEVTRADLAEIIRFVRSRATDFANQAGEDPKLALRLCSVHYLNLMNLGVDPRVKDKLAHSATSSSVTAHYGKPMDATLPSVARLYGREAASLAQQLRTHNNR